jgi:hypothetical protein
VAPSGSLSIPSVIPQVRWTLDFEFVGKISHGSGECVARHGGSLECLGLILREAYWRSFDIFRDRSEPPAHTLCWGESLSVPSQQAQA